MMQETAFAIVATAVEINRNILKKQKVAGHPIYIDMGSFREGN